MRRGRQRCCSRARSCRRDAVTIRKANFKGDITEIGMQEAFSAAGLDSPDLETRYYD